jgi:hypothetical protein
MGDLLETAIPILGGLYATLVGHRVIGTGNKYESQLRILGPLIVLFGIIQLIRAIERHYF